jgi:hypothetical protein
LVEHLAHYLMIEGSKPAAGIGLKKMARIGYNRTPKGG